MISNFETNNQMSFIKRGTFHPSFVGVNTKSEFCIEAKIVVIHYDHINHFLCISNFIMTLYDSNVLKFDDRTKAHIIGLERSKNIIWHSPKIW
jgi:hypothetical protein